MKSLTLDEARHYCKESAYNLGISKAGTLFYKRSKLPGFFVKAPLEMRQIIIFVTTVISATKGPKFAGGLVWFTRLDVGVIDSASLGWKVIEDIRRANGDHRSLDVASAQQFRSTEETELIVFLLQAVAFGWAGYFLPAGFDCFVNFRSSERWFFHSSLRENLDAMYSALEPWNPVYEGHDAAS
jgi:hypothetical protein